MCERLFSDRKGKNSTPLLLVHTKVSNPPTIPAPPLLLIYTKVSNPPYYSSPPYYTEPESSHFERRN